MGQEEMKNFLKLNENENTTNSGLWHTMKVILKGKVITLSVYINKLRSSQTSNLIEHPKDLEQKKSQQHKINSGFTSIK